jgi:hypothetical protein
MIVIRVELWSAVTGQVRELARMTIANRGDGTRARRNYDGVTFRGRDSAALDKCIPSKTGKIDGWPSERVHVWNLVRRMLEVMGYTQ